MVMSCKKKGGKVLGPLGVLGLGFFMSLQDGALQSK